MHHLKRMSGVAAALVAVALLTSACFESSDGTAQKTESKTQQTSYTDLVAAQPAHKMTYSPTRATLNFWIDTWNKPNQLAYVWIRDAQDDITGYYILVGPPVSSCVAVTPTYKIINPGGSGDHPNIAVPAPSVDGAYYSGGQCSVYFGKDASNGSYQEFSIGQSQSFTLTNAPLPPQKVQGAKALGDATIENVKKSG